MTQWVANNNYNLGTSNLTQPSKNFIRQSGSVGTFSATSHEGYPTNTAIEYKLPSNPFITTASSRNIKVKFEASDASVFLNNIGKKIQDLEFFKLLPHHIVGILLVLPLPSTIL